MVVDVHRLFDHLGSLLKVNRTLQQELTLEDAVDPLGQCVLIAVVPVSHRTAQTVTSMDVLIVGRAVLDPAIGVMDQWLAGLAPAQRLLQRLTDLLGLQAVVYVMTDDLARERIRDEAQIHKRASRRQVRDVGHPHLFGAGRHDSIRPGFQQIRMAPEAMMALRCLVVSPAGHDEQARGAQYIEQPISPQLDAVLDQRWPEKMMQFSCPKSGLTQPCIPH
ncbi:hypothetical protein BLA6993_07990 [Burkholderia lata]|nr:hypothetical protein BLA6993_07990 [Burkholderia lata]